MESSVRSGGWPRHGLPIASRVVVIGFSAAPTDFYASWLLKSKVGVRDDMFTEYLRKFVSDCKGLLFPSRKRTTPISYRSFLKRILTPSMKKAWHQGAGKGGTCFPPFPVPQILAKSGVEEDIRKFWLGHENNDISAQYAEQIREDDTYGGILWRRRSNSDSRFRHSFRSQLSVIPVKIVRQSGRIGGLSD